MKCYLPLLKSLLLLVAFLMSIPSFASQEKVKGQKSVIYSTNFELFTAGEQLACQDSVNWTTWSNTPCTAEDAYISTDFANSGLNSTKVENGTDLLLLLGDLTTGSYELSWSMYIETGNAGYYNIQHFEDPGVEFAFEIYFLENGTAQFTTQALPAIEFSYPKDTWFLVKHIIDIDNDLITLSVNNSPIHTWPLSALSNVATPGTLQLGSVDFFAGATGTEVPKYYFDDVKFKEVQPPIYTTNFESFTAGGQLACQDSVNWTTWSNTPCTAEDAYISTDFANSGINSTKVENGTDLLLLLGDLSTGSYELSWSMYIETGTAGYYNIQHFEEPGVEFAFEIYFLENGTAQFTTQALPAIEFSYPKDAWFLVKHIIDIDNDLITLSVNNSPIHTWPFSALSNSATPGTNQLGSVDFFAGATGTEVPKYYFDDVLFTEIPPPIFETDFEAFTAGGQLACQDPVNWTTWSNTPCTAEDAYISTDFANSGINSTKVENGTDLLLLLGDLTTGSYELSWSMYIETGTAGYYNIQHFEEPGVEFAFEIYFLENGTAQFTTQALPAIEFSYPKDIWFSVKHIIDIDNDLITLTVNSSPVHTWPFSALSNVATAGTNQLGSVDFFAGATGTEVPKYYFDDVVFKDADEQAIANDLSLQSILSPVSGPNLTDAETVAITVKNLGTNAQTDIEVSYSVNGGTPISEIIEGELAGGSEVEYTFTQTADLSAVESYNFVASVTLEGDETPDNNYKEKTVVNEGNIILMQSGTISSCDGNFYDTGGEAGPYQNSEDLILTLAPSTPGAKIIVTFNEFSTENNYDYLSVFDGSDINAPLLGTYTGTLQLGEFVASQANTIGDLTFHFTSDGSATSTGWAATIACELPKDHDLAGVEINGPVNLDIGTTGDYIVTIGNFGLNPEAGSSYTVSLYDDNSTLIATVDGLDIEAGELQYFTIPWTPETDGPAYLYAIVSMVGDENPENDQTSDFNVYVQPAGQASIIIGTGIDLSSNVPIYPYFGYSFTQTLYLQSEMNIADKRIFRIGYQYGGPTTDLEFDIEIWLAHTSLSELTTTVPLATFTQVYDGPYTVNPSGDFSTVDIEAFYYNNTDNLLLTIIEKKPGYTSSEDQFFSTPNEPPQTMCLGAWNDGSPYDPDNLPDGNVIAMRANTKFWLGDVPTDPEIKITPASIYFGEVEATVSEIRTIEVMNSGGGTLVINGADISNPRFSILDASYPINLEIGEKHTFEVEFLPVDPGLEEGELIFLIDESVPGIRSAQLSGRALRFGVLRESFEGEMFPPLGWRIVDNNNDGKGWVRNAGFAPTGQTAPRTGIACASLDVYAGTPSQISYDDWLITPKMIWQDGDVFKFYIKRLANQAGQTWRVCYSTSGDDVSDFISIDEITDPTMNYEELAYDLSQFGLIDGETFYMGIQFNSLWCWPGVIDDVLGSVLDRFENDLMVLDFSGDDILYENATGNYQTMIGNYGTNAVADDEYQVQICAYVGGVETVLASMPGVAIESGETLSLDIPLTIAEEGVYSLYSKVVWEEDMDPSNNFSEQYTVEVIPASIVVVNIGDFPITGESSYTYNYPINFEDTWRSTSLSEVMYYANELNVGGIIQRLSYYKNFGSDMSQRKLKIWMGETEQTTLDGSYLPPSQLQLVFDGKVDFTEGFGKASIELSNPYVYTGSGNLVVNVYYYEGSSASDAAKFAFTESAYPLRTIYETGWQAIDPENPAYIGTVSNYPTTSLRFETGNGTGTLSGYVYYQADNQPVEGAAIEIYNPDFPDATAVIYTDATGNYSAPYAMAGDNLTVTISKYEYSDVIFDDVVLPVNGSVSLEDALLQLRPSISLSGNVILSDTQEPAEGAFITISGLDTYETTTDANGDFIFEEVWGSTDYQIEISLSEYQLYQSTISVPEVNYLLDQITLLENAPAPHLANAVEDGDDALISWYAAGQPYPMEFRYDDGNVDGVLITTGSTTVVIGSAWPNNASLDRVYWYMYDHPNYTLPDMVMITVLGLTEDGTPDPNDILLIEEEVPNSANWNNRRLSVPVDAPNGFFVGISGYNNTSIIPYDDGEGEPYVFQTRTQWSNGLGAYNPLENATSPPLHANIFVRASGFASGEILAFSESSSNTYMINIPEGMEPSVCQQVPAFNSGSPEIIYPTIPQNPSKGFTNYNIYRKLLTENVWEQLNSAPVMDTSFVDEGWSGISYGQYEFAAEAEYTNGVKSELAISNILEKDMRLDFNLTVNTNTNVAGISAGANVILRNQNGNVNYIYYAVVGVDGTIEIPEVLKGIYTLEIIHTGFEDFIENDINLEVPGTVFEITVELIERIFNPYDLELITAGQEPGAALFMWDQAPVLDDVESYEAFMIENIGDWTTIDQDAKTTVYPSGVSFPHVGEAASFMTFSSEQTTPPLTQVYWGANSGSNCFAAFGSSEGSTNNWLISKQQNHSLPFTLSFYAKSITENYGLETFVISYSTGGNSISDFVSVTDNETALTYWTKFTYTIPAEAKYVAIRHNHTGFALLIDDITLGVETDGAIPANGFTVYLNDEELASGLMTPEYQFEGLVYGTYTAGVKADFYTGQSEIEEIDFEMPEGTQVNFTVYDDLGSPVDDATIGILYEGIEIISAQTLNGFASFQIYPGTYEYLVSKEGYATVSENLVVGTVSLDIEIVLNNFYDLTFIVTDENNLPIEAATVVYKEESKLTSANGEAEFMTTPGTFSYAVTHPDYGNVLASLTVLDDGIENVVMPALSCEAPTNLNYAIDYNNVALTWDAPEIGNNGEWIHWDVEHGNNVGTGGSVDFDIAQRYEPADLMPYDGKFLTRVIFFPNEVACTYSIRVWVDGYSSSAGSLLVDQEVTNPIIGEWNEIFLSTPVLVDASRELWIGTRNNTTTGHPAGCDIGPAIDGKGNMINLAGGGWQTLLEVAPTLDYNWNVRGLLEDVGSDNVIPLQALNDGDRGSFTGKLSNMMETKAFSDPRELLGYNLYCNNVQLNTILITELTYMDNAVPNGSYDYNVSALWSNDCESEFSNTAEVLIAGEYGKIQGFVRDAVTNISIETATLIAENADNGVETQITPFGSHYSFLLLPGNYSITCLADGYLPQTVLGLQVEIGVNTGQTFYLEPTDQITEIGENERNRLVIYPNPANEKVTISGVNIKEVHVFNLTGSRVYSSHTENGIVEIYNLSEGMYFVKAISLGGKVHTKKLVIK